jgi:Flp pilus assembly pilin Flp
VRSESGFTLVEYGVIAAALGLLIMLSMSTGSS